MTNDKISMNEKYADLRADLCNIRRFGLSETKSICVYLRNKFKLKFLILFFFLCIDLFMFAYNFYIFYFI